MSQTTLLEYEAPWPVYALDWCNTPAPGQQLRPKSSFRLAISSFTEDYRNRLAIVGLRDENVLLDDDDYPPVEPDFYMMADTMHGYPATKLQWQPSSSTNFNWNSKSPNSELLATVGDALRIWELFTEGEPKGSSFLGRQSTQPQAKLAQKIALSGSKSPPNVSAAPLTSFSWNSITPSLLVTSSIDTTCTVWDINTFSAITQLIAHDREVYDVAWLPSSTDIFCSVGADGSLRAFDLRSLEHSTILYETPAPKTAPSAIPPSSSARPPSAPLLRIAFNPSDHNFMATYHLDSPDVHILDMRSPGQPVVELKGHRRQVNALGFSQSDGGSLATVGDDCQLLLWDLSNIPPAPSPQASRGTDTKRMKYTEPYLAWSGQSEINNIAWSPQLPRFTLSNGFSTSQSEWVAIAMGKSVKCLRV
ncbi:WD40 repeat-like protein [Sistotremastrum niveocremeum HHB9708]|uniref:WD40 repeat-like protein n=1 Tax=Sistotremastrum niveocremeum HHB9708 TaxID=1314777 RepID=A0A165A2E7_9AGAM|nr:WD40 repeat-like protein [Sistotremastrum niveocremeum HHB9708]